MWTSTQLIHHAAMKMQKVTTTMGKVVEYSAPELVEVKDETCWLCGGETKGKGQPTKKAIKQTFTDHPYARGQGSNSICPGCTFCLSKRELRNYSVLATEKLLMHPSRAEWKEILLSPPEPPFVACLAVSGQKHLTFKAPVNLNNNLFVVALEEQMIKVTPDKLKSILEIVESLYMYFTKDEILTGRYSQNRIKEIGINRCEELESKISASRGSRLFELAIFVAQKQEKPEVIDDGPVSVTCAGRKTEDTGVIQLGFDWD